MKLEVLLFFALIVNISAHDHLKSRHHVHSRHSHLKSRDNSGENGNNQTESQGVRLCISYNASTGVEFVYNLTARVGAVVDSNSSIVVIFSDASDVAVAVNFKLKTGVQLRSDNLNGCWSEYLSSQTSLQGVVDTRKKSSFNATNPPSDVAQKVGPILGNLSSQYSKLPNFIDDVDAETTVIRQFPKNINSFTIRIRGDFVLVVQRFEGLGILLNGSNAAGNGSFSPDLGSLLQQSSGIDFVRRFIEQLPPGTNLQNVLGNGTQSTQGFLSFLGQFDSFSRVVSSIVSAQNGSSQVQDLVRSLIDYFRNPPSGGDQQWSTAIQNLLNATGRFNANGSIPQNLQNFDLQSLLNGTQNASDIINALRNRDQNGGIFNIVRILGALSSVVPANESIPNLLGQLISLFRTTDNTSILSRIIPNDSSSRFGSVGNIVSDFISIFTRAIQAGIRIGEFFVSLPLRFFVAPLVAAVTEYFRSMNFTDLFRSRNAIEFFIRGLTAFIRMPFSFFSAFVKGFETAFGAGVQMGEEVVQGIAQAVGGASNNGTNQTGGGILSGLPFINGSIESSLSREHTNDRHFHKGDHGHHHHRHHHHGHHHPYKSHQEKEHGVIEKGHEIHHKKREIKEIITQKRHDIKQKKHEVHHS